MISLTPERSAFGRHETFPLRFGWLTKGVGAWTENPNVFEEEEAIVKLGVGKPTACDKNCLREKMFFRHSK